jgi:2-succinyl-6-hydroxy-2,4-cyclohexadiene-1-carboxylate synthase
VTLKVATCGDVEIAFIDEGAGPTALVLHGFTGSAEAMRSMLDALTPTHRVIAPDLVGHGGSSRPADVALYTTEATVRHLDAVLEAAVVDDVSVVGYSLGGRLGLSYACANPDRVRAMALIGTTGGIEEGLARSERRAADEALAERLERDGVEAFVDHWEQIPMFASQLRLPEQTRQSIRAGRMAQSATGLANSLRGVGAGVMPPVWARLGAIDVPARLIVGSLDTKYVELAQRLVRSLPRAEVTVVEGVGHAAHVEAPQTCASLVLEALD